MEGFEKEGSWNIANSNVRIVTQLRVYHPLLCFHSLIVLLMWTSFIVQVCLGMHVWVLKFAEGEEGECSPTRYSASITLRQHLIFIDTSFASRTPLNIQATVIMFQSVEILGLSLFISTTASQYTFGARRGGSGEGRRPWVEDQPISFIGAGLNEPRIVISPLALEMFSSQPQ